MKIKAIYANKNEYLNVTLVELPDGSLHTFRRTPYRKISEISLTQVQSKMRKDVYLGAAHWAPYVNDAILQFELSQYGLDLVEQ